MSNTTVETQIHGLITQLEDYLAGRLSHEDIQTRVEQHFKAWDTDAAWHAAPYAPGERAFWCALWTAQHLADDEHWKDGLPQRDLLVIIDALRHNRELPVGWQGRRPDDINAA